MSTALERRSATLRSASRGGLDLVVIGGGINGAGILLDAAARGLKTLLVERDDLAVGTSSRSSKLIHGGLRYLEQYEFGLVREALQERGTLLRLAPHLVHLRRFVFPVSGSWWERPYVATGLSLYDTLGGHRGGRFRSLSVERLAARVPDLKMDEIRGGFEYSDGVTDDARFVVAVARTARRLGAQLVTRADVEGLLYRSGRVAGVSVTDRVTGGSIDIPSACVVDATGAFNVEPGQSTLSRLVLSRGTHLVIPRERIDSCVGLTMHVGNRVVFLTPWQGWWLLGTTDVVHEGSVHHPAATADELSYLLGAANDSLDVGLTADDVVATFAGIRPLVGSASQAPGSISREEHIEERPDGLITLRGGKFTTYRRTSAEVVDRVCARTGRSARSCTVNVPLVGAAPRRALTLLTRQLTEDGLEDDIARSLVSRYGTEAVDVAAAANRHGTDARLIERLPYIEAEVCWAVDREEALGVDDVLARRTRAAIQDRDQARSAASTVADLLGEQLGWDEACRREAIETYGASSEEYAVPQHSHRIREAKVG